jgi:DNA-binding response OmpR family regulator
VKARIIVIDDQEPIRRIIHRALEKEGYEVLEASDGEMGVDLLRRSGAALVITDIFMPGQDGIQTLRQIRREFPTVKVIAMSGGGTTGQDLIGGAELLGAARTLDKPFTAHEVVALVGEVLQGRP